MADDTGGCFKGDKIDLTSLRTPEQQEMMAALGQALGPMLSQGATPYGGQINAPYDPAMLSAMNMMMQVGGQGPYQPFNFPTMAPQGGGSGGGPGGGGGGGGTGSPGHTASGTESVRNQPGPAPRFGAHNWRPRGGVPERSRVGAHQVRQREIDLANQPWWYNLPRPGGRD